MPSAWRGWQARRARGRCRPERLSARLCRSQGGFTLVEHAQSGPGGAAGAAGCVEVRPGDGRCGGLPPGRSLPCQGRAVPAPAGLHGGRMKLRMGLQARFLAPMSLLLVVVLVLLGLVLQRQQAMRQEAEELSRAAIRELIQAPRHAPARTLAKQLAPSLARPLQEGDTEAIAALLREQRQDGLVRYLQVADAHGRVVQEAGRADEGPFRVIEPPAGAPPVAEVVVRQDEDVLE